MNGKDDRNFSLLLVLMFYSLYYRYEPSRVTTCPLTIHALLHIASDTRHAGPLSRIWEFATERSMGVIARSVKSKRLPFAQLAETVKMREQLKAVGIRYNLIRELSLRKPRRNWKELTSKETMLREISRPTLPLVLYVAHLGQIKQQYS
jgi:hypothetical protein